MARTEEEETTFKVALACMHHMYFYADVVIHLPFDDYSVAGEEQEYRVQASALEGSVYAQVGEWVQIVDQIGGPSVPVPVDRKALAGIVRTRVLKKENSENTMHRVIQAARTRTRTAPFDRVLAVDDVVVLSLQHLQTMMEEQVSAGQGTVKLCRYPFGKTNMIHLDDRGWLFLERFITMVKCAMLEPAAAKSVVIASSDALSAYIENGASRLREAAQLDKDHGTAGSQADSRLQLVLSKFVTELSTKRFSSTSFDKQKSSASAHPCEDAVIVQTIMSEFARHLQQNWQQEAQEQKKRGLRLALQDYLLSWNSFSIGYLVQWRSRQHHTWPLVIVLICPPLFTFVVTLAPFNPPNMGPRDQSLFWGVFCSVGMAGCYFFACFVPECSGMELSAAVGVKLLAWSAVVGLTVVTLAFAVSDVLDVFPLPLAMLWAPAFVTVFVPLIWMCASFEQRKDSAFRLRFVYSVVASLLLIWIFGVGFPFLNKAIKSATLLGQALIIVVFLVAKLCFERLGNILSHQIGANPMPSFVFVATMCYEVDVTVALCGGANWIIFVELVAFNVIENFYHLWSLAHSSLAAESGRDVFIVSSLLVREFVEVAVPVQMLVIVTVIQVVNPQLNSIVCHMSVPEFEHVQLLLVVDIIIEVAIMILTYRFLRRAGYHPFDMLRGFISMHFKSMASGGVMVCAFYFCLQHSHTGMDLSLQFKWFHSSTAEWQCGLTWK